MAIWKKTISTVMSAALLASLLATAVAPAALATTTVTSAGSVAIGQTSTTAASFLFTEADVNLAYAGNFDVYIFDNGASCSNSIAANAAFANVEFVGPATISAPGSLDASVTLGANFFNVDIADDDNFNVETILIGGLKIKALAGAATGAIKACVYNDDEGVFGAAFAVGTTTATGKLVGAIGQFAVTFQIALDTGSCEFSTATQLRPLKIAGANPETIPAVGQANAVVDPAIGGIQTVLGVNPTLVPAGTTFNHLANDVITQTVTNCTVTALGSPGTVTDSLIYNPTGGQTRVNPGETNQGPVFDLSATERSAGFLTKGATITLTIATAGVTFSSAPNADRTAGNILLTGVSTGSSNIFGVLAGDHKSVTWTVDTKSTTASTIVFDDIRYDVASTVAFGTSVDVTLATSAGAVQPTSRSNAVVGRVLSVTATTPTVYIGENNQTAGQVTIVETGPGFFIAGAGNKNTFAICLGDPTQPQRFASAPWAKVTAGDLVLREGDVASTDKVVQGKVVTAGGPDIFECYYWTVWTASTVASTVVISGDEAGTMGVKINVPAGLSPGPVEVGIRTGDIQPGFFNNTLEARVSIGNRVFRNQVLVTALSQPLIPAGVGNALAGDIQIAETAAGQLKDGQFICVEVLPRASNFSIQDTFLKGLNTADQPLATASGGVVVSAVSMSNERCSGGTVAGPTLLRSFSFRVNQQANTGTGKIVISNIHYGTTADAPAGPVLVNVWARGASNTQLDLQGVVSNAKIGVKAAIAISADSALGLMPNQGAWSTSTKVAAANKYITWRFRGGSALAGKLVQIHVATKNANGGWGPFVVLTSRLADASGTAYFQWRATGVWVSVRSYYAGDTSVAESWSPARQGRWK